MIMNQEPKASSSVSLTFSVLYCHIKHRVLCQLFFYCTIIPSQIKIVKPDFLKILKVRIVKNHDPLFIIGSDIKNLSEGNSGIASVFFPCPAEALPAFKYVPGIEVFYIFKYQAILKFCDFHIDTPFKQSCFWFRVLRFAFRVLKPVFEALFQALATRNSQLAAITWQNPRATRLLGSFFYVYT